MYSSIFLSFKRHLWSFFSFATLGSNRKAPWSAVAWGTLMDDKVIFASPGRYLFLNAIANQLRYPNSHTHYFSCVLLYLFAEANTEAIQEQITRCVQIFPKLSFFALRWNHFVPNTASFLLYKSKRLWLKLILRDIWFARKTDEMENENEKKTRFCANFRP